MRVEVTAGLLEVAAPRRTLCGRRVRGGEFGGEFAQTRPMTMRVVAVAGTDEPGFVGSVPPAQHTVVPAAVAGHRGDGTGVLETDRGEHRRDRRRRYRRGRRR